jgi:hypothetical protein
LAVALDLAGRRRLRHVAQAYVKVERPADCPEALDAAAAFEAQPAEPLAAEPIARVAYRLQHRPVALPGIDLEARQPHHVDQVIVVERRHHRRPRRRRTMLSGDVGAGVGARHDAEDRRGVASDDEDMRSAAHPALQHVEGGTPLERFHLETIFDAQEAGDAFGITGRRESDAAARRQGTRQRTGR